MKKIWMTVCCLLLTISLSGCGKDAGTCGDDSLDIAKLMETVNSKTNDQDWKAGILQDNGIDAAILQTYYHINSVNIQEYTVRTALLETDATEIAVFHATSEHMQEVKDGVKYRIEFLKTKWKDVDKAQYKLVKNYQTVQCGNYYFLVIAEDAKSIADFMEAF